MRYDKSVETLAITPVRGPVVGVARVPGSKSITNRALALAALADGETLLTEALFADDTARMMDCLKALGFAVRADEAASTIAVTGLGGRVPAVTAELFVGNSGTTARFITPLAALGNGVYMLDGVPRMRERPIGDLLEALRGLGVEAVSVYENGCPPVRMVAAGLEGGETSIRADKSSQFLSGLLLAAPCADGNETVIHVEGPILSAPYIEMTVAMARSFGATMQVSDDGRIYRIPGRQCYQSPGTYAIEPDASSATYFWAAAALTGGRVRVNGIGTEALQGDAAFVDVLEAMGCRVTRASNYIEVEGTGTLHGIQRDMNDISDTVMTLAALAPFADSPTTIDNVAHIRHKETDRLSAITMELERLGVRVDERPDSMTIYPTEQITPATIQTYDDHRMAMAFALIGLRAEGVTIADPNCVRKTFPDYFERLAELTGEAG